MICGAASGVLGGQPTYHLTLKLLKLHGLNTGSKGNILADILLRYFHWFCRLLLNLMTLIVVPQVLTKLLRSQSKLLCQTI
jgi:hypothetical protein